jgi:hypothetical protein
MQANGCRSQVTNLVWNGAACGALEGFVRVPGATGGDSRQRVKQQPYSNGMEASL